MDEGITVVLSEREAVAAATLLAQAVENIASARASGTLSAGELETLASQSVDLGRAAQKLIAALARYQHAAN